MSLLFLFVFSIPVNLFYSLKLLQNKKKLKIFKNYFQNVLISKMLVIDLLSNTFPFSLCFIINVIFYDQLSFIFLKPSKCLKAFFSNNLLNISKLDFKSI